MNSPHPSPPSAIPPRGVVFGFDPGAIHRAGRTERSLAAVGVAVAEEPAWTPALLAARLRANSGPVMLAQAGAWLRREEAWRAIPASATGRPLLGIGAIAGNAAWRKYLGRCGGDLQRHSWLPFRVPEVASLYLESASATVLADLIERGRTLRAAVQQLIRERTLRAVHLAALDVHVDARLRALQVVTTIQIGGAERVTLDLAEELPRHGVRVAVAALGRPTRLAFTTPARFFDLSEIANNPDARAEAIARCARHFGADLIHAHLIRAAEARALKKRGLPVALTLHNLPAAWPAGFTTADAGTADLLLACGQTVARAAEATGIPIPLRTIWNGIEPRPLLPTAATRDAGMAWRARLGWIANDFVLVAVANPRPQKRLDRLPAIVHALQRLQPARTVRLILAGACGEGTAEAHDAIAALDAALIRWPLGASIHRTGAVADVAPILAAADVFVSTSAYEGLSLAQLEALAAGLSVVATHVGGAGEIARQSPHVHLLPADATPADFARCLTALAGTPRARESALPTSFTRYRMAARTRDLYPRIIERARAAPVREEVWLITNNFSTGGAQSSARRLLLGLAGRGVKVRAFTVQEDPDHPTPGRAALVREGIPVTAIAPPLDSDAAHPVAQILTAAARRPPQAVVFWNLIASYKVLLADGFFAPRIYDVSPGGMYYSSFARYFAAPRPGLPYLSLAEYGARLAGIVVKYAAETDIAAELGTSVHVIRNGVPITTSLSRDAAPPHARLVIGTAARLSPDKRLEDLLDAVRAAHPRLPPYVLRIAGGADRETRVYARTLRERARGLSVEWCGALPDTAEFLSGIDIFAMISEPAGCPNASLEAMAAGLPVAATDVGGASEQVLDGITGRLVSARDPEVFATALVELAHDREKRRRCGSAARAHVRDEFSMETMVERYRALLLGEFNTAVTPAEPGAQLLEDHGC